LLVWTGSAWSALSAGGGSGEGDVEGPDGGVADGEVALFDGTTGKAIKAGRGHDFASWRRRARGRTDTDTSNRLVVKASRAVFYAREDAETPGTGDIKIQISKEAEGNSASFFFSTNFSGRAEFGLVEGDNFLLKVFARRLGLGGGAHRRSGERQGALPENDVAEIVLLADQAAYDALDPPDERTLYLIPEEE
jgi:hypothetical protein